MNVPVRSDPRAAARRRAGFTLVELLVSMVVLALVAVVMTSGLRFVLRAMSSTDSRREAMEELTLGLSVLRGELERAEPLMVKVGKRDLVLFSGGSDRVRFGNVEPPYLHGPPYLAYEYAVVPDNGGNYRIELRRAALDPAAPDLAVVEAGEARTVLRVGPELRFSYFGKLGERDAAAWHKSWPIGPKLPQAIRLAAGDDPAWPELTVAMRVMAPWYCGVAEGPSTAGCSDKPEQGQREGLEPGDDANKPFGQAGGSSESKFGQGGGKSESNFGKSTSSFDKGSQ